MKRLGPFLVALALAGAVGVVLLARGSGSTPVSAPAQADRDPLASEVRRLRAEMSALQARSAQAALQVPAAAPGAANAVSTPVSVEQRAERARANRATWYAFLDTKLGGEGADPGWSADANRKLQDTVRRRADLGTLVSSDCASSMCKLVVSHTDVSAQRAFVTELAGELDGQAVYKYDRDVMPPTTTIWVARKGTKLPRPQR
jgi:hypothetical protein